MNNAKQDASIPGHFPTQDGVDRSDHLAVIMSISLDPTAFQSQDFDWDRFQTVRPNYELWIKESLTELTGEHPKLSAEPNLELEHYQVGPAAGGMIDNIQMIATFVEFATQAYGTVELARFVYSLSQGVKAKATSWSTNQGFETLMVQRAYPPLMLKHMAIGYLMDFHGYVPDTEVYIECLSREFFDGYSSPAHPTNAVEYLVVAPTAAGAYRMKINGDSRIVYLRKEEAEMSRLLPTLPYLDDLEEEPHDPNIP